MPNTLPDSIQDYLEEFQQEIDGVSYRGDCSDSEREYTTFLGMAVQSFDASLQYSGGGSTVVIRLYDDWCNCNGNQQCKVNKPWREMLSDEQWSPNVFRGMDRYVRDPETGGQLYHDENKQQPVVLSKLFDVRDCIGSPFKFKYGLFEFCGILQSLQPSEDEQGTVAWQATLKSPEEIVEGCQIILSGYHDDYAIPNVFNLCYDLDVIKQNINCLKYNSIPRGYAWQTFPPMMKQPDALTIRSHPEIYGQSYPLVSVSLLEFISKTIIGKMYYNEVLWLLQRRCGSTATGTGIQWKCFAPIGCPDRIGRGHYILDISEMPGGVNSHTRQVPEHYRVSGTQMSIGAFVKQVCDEFRLDFFWELIYAWDGSVTGLTDEEMLDRQGIYGQPVLKLRTSPKGKRTKINVHSIEDTVRFLKQEIVDRDGQVVKPAYPVNSYSSGVEETDELSSFMLTGANRNMLIEATGGVITGWTNNYGNFPVTDLLALKTEMENLVEQRDSTIFAIAKKLNLYEYIGNVNITADTILRLFGKAINSQDYPELGVIAKQIEDIQERIKKEREGHGKDSIVPMPTGTVWAMYFGQDRFNNPQIMFDDVYWTSWDWSYWDKNEDGSVTPLERPTMYRNAKVTLDTYELYPGLRFFTNPTGSAYYDRDEVISETRHVYGVAMDWGDYTFPDYITVSEEELRASGSSTLFWEEVVKMKGDLFRLFIEVLDISILTNLSHYTGMSSTTPSSEEIFMGRQDEWTSFAVAYMESSAIMPMARFSMDFDNQDKNVESYRRIIMDLIHDDLVNIAAWVREIAQKFYGKYFCTPFYFTENRAVYDDKGYQLYSYEPTHYGFRESGAFDLLGLEAKDVLVEGKPGLEAFINEQGMVKSFFRFWNPLIPVESNPVLHKQNNWGRDPSTTEGNTEGYIPEYNSTTGVNAQINIERSDGSIQAIHYIHQLDLSSFAPRDVVQNDGWLYLQMESVQYIPKSNLVLAQLSRPMFLHDPKSNEGRYNTSAEFRSLQMGTEVEIDHKLKNEWKDESDEEKRRLSKAYRKKRGEEYYRYSNMNSHVGGSHAYSQKMPEAARPIDGVYGVKCNFARYGPWSVSNGNGKAKFEKNTALAPWTYSNKYLNADVAHARMHERAIMQLAGELSQQKWNNCSEQGQITFGGVPSVKLGAELDDIVFSYQTLDEKRQRLLDYQRHGNVLLEYNEGNRMPVLKKQQGELFFKIYGLLDTFLFHLASAGYMEIAEDMTQHILAQDVSGLGYNYWHLPYKPLGLSSPVVSRVEVSFTQDGTVTTKYSINKETQRTGFLAKHFVEKIEASHAWGQGNTERHDAYVQRQLDTWSDNQSRDIARDVSDMGLTGTTAAGRMRAAQNVTSTRGQTFREHFGKRAASESPHNVIMGEILGEIKESARKEGKTVSKENMDVMTRSVVNFGDTYQDLYRMLETSEGYTNKAFVSIDALLTPYATTDIQDAKLYEKELQLTIKENQENEGNTPATGQNAVSDSEQSPYMDNFLVPTFRKPKQTTYNTSKFSDLESLKRYNENNEVTTGAFQNVVLNSQYLNPLVNPKDVDHNDLASDGVVTKGKSDFGHNIGVISKGVVPPPNVNTTSARMDGNNPYHPHYRSLSLTAPLVLTGWGYNQDYRPVPRPYDAADHFVPNFASRRDLWATGPVEMLFDEQRGVWCAPPIRMHYVMMVEDMRLIDNSNQVKRDFHDYDDGYRAGEARGKQDKQTEVSNLNRTQSDQVQLEGLDHQGMIENGQAWSDGHVSGYENGYYGTPKQERVMPVAKFSRGPAKIMDDPLGIVSYINVDVLSDARLQKGDYTLAVYNKGHWLAIPNGMSIRTGLVTRRIEPTTYLNVPNEETGEVLSGGGWVVELSQGATTNTQIRAFCGMVTTTENSIQEGVFVQYIYIGGRAWVIGKHC